MTESARARLLGSVLLAASLPWAVAALFPPLSHDAAAVLHFAERMLDGDRLYVDLIDINPPMIFWLNLIPAALARMTGLPTPPLLIGAILVLVAGSLSLCRALVSDSAVWRSNAVLRALLPPIVLYSLIVLPAHSFAQREQLILALSLPYLVAAIRRLEGARTPPLLALTTGVMLAIALSIKPHFALAPTLIELALIARLGWRRSLSDPTPWAVLLGGVAYVAAIGLFTPAFFANALPLALNRYAADGSGGLVEMLKGPFVPGLALGLIVFTALSIGRREFGAATILALFTLAATVAAIAQDKGWDYHFLTARGGMVLLAVTALAAILPTAPPRRLAAGVVVLLLITGSALAPPFAPQMRYASSTTARMTELIRREAAGAPVLVLSSSIAPHFPALTYTASRLAGPYMSLWLLPALYRDAPADQGRILFPPLDQMPADEAALFRSVVDALTNQAPALILVAPSRREGYGGREFDYLGYFSRDPSFAIGLKAFREIDPIDGWQVFKRS